MIRFFIIVSLLLTFCISTHAQDNAAASILYKRKVQTYRKMERIGLGLMIGGGVSTAIGAILVSDYSNGGAYTTPVTVPGQPAQHSNPNAGNYFGIGSLCLLTGIPSFITGSVLFAVAARKVHYYKKKQSGLSLGLSPKGIGLSLTYKF